jgi:hypothetical protein
VAGCFEQSKLAGFGLSPVARRCKHSNKLAGFG